MNEIPDRPLLAAHVRRQIDRQTGRAMLLHPEGAIELSGTADAIVRMCEGSHTIDGMVAVLREQYEAPEEVLRTDVMECLRGLAALGVLAPA